jgi:hypothetical protein
MSTADRKNQRQRILDLLLAAHGEEVPSVALSRISLQYGARVKELRELGLRIVNRTERRSGQVHGYFRLEAGMPATEDAACDSPKRLAVADATGSLFGDLAPDRSYAE